jgi:hypothetical protein
MSRHDCTKALLYKQLHEKYMCEGEYKYLEISLGSGNTKFSRSENSARLSVPSNILFNFELIDILFST